MALFILQALAAQMLAARPKVELHLPEIQVSAD